MRTLTAFLTTAALGLGGAAPATAAAGGAAVRGEAAPVTAAARGEVARGASGPAPGAARAGLCASKKKKKRRAASQRRRAPPPSETEAELPEVSARAAAALFDETAEAESSAPAEEGRRGSELTPGAASRWSNSGALEPVESPVPLQAPLPERNQPRPIGVQTPGQRLRGDEDLLSARVSISGYRLATTGQDLVYADQLDENGRLVRRDGDRDIELLRGRATLAYERIAGSEVSAHLDVEGRPRLSGDGRFDDARLNALYVAWGLTDVRARGGPDVGVALGRLAIREAGYAQADGAAVRWRPIPELHVGAFGGVTGNPYGYNWALRAPEVFSADWVTGGVFGRWRGPRVQASLAAVLTVSNVPRPPPDPGSTDRVYVHADVAWQPLRELSVFATGFVDLLPSGQLVQNAELAAAYTLDGWNLRVGLGRFSTLSYALSNGYTYIVDPARNTLGEGPANNAPIVDENGDAIVPFDAARLTAIYNQVRVSAAYRLLTHLEVYARVDTLIRDVSLARSQSSEALGAEVPLAPTVDFAPLRLLPAAGARFRDPALFDADAQLTAIVDEQSQADAILQAGIGRAFLGFYARADARYLVGDISALDGGLSLSYSFPRDWLPGLLQVRGALRYFREDLALERPASPEQTGQLGPDEQRALIPAQESFLGFAGVEWRL